MQCCAMQADFFRQNIRFHEDSDAWDEKGCHLAHFNFNYFWANLADLK
jgi:hypothetical protein